MNKQIKNYFKIFIPKLFECFKDGTFSMKLIHKDIIAGIIVAIVALPLSMALAIASGVSPEHGLYTAIVAGFLISFFGGSRFQIGGPTGAFVVIVFGVVQQYGYEGLVIATLMAGVMLIIAGMLKFGNVMKYIPYPVVVGFTAGIALIIFSTQIQAFFGLSIENLPAEFLHKWIAYIKHFNTLHIPTLIIGISTLSIIILINKTKPVIPSFLVAILITSGCVYFFDIQVATIGSKFGGLSSKLPSFAFPVLSYEKIMLLMTPAFIIAFLAGIESLLSTTVADSMTNSKHKPNTELIAQGIANIGSVLFGGIPATGAIARTATNIKSGGRTPLAGIFHAIFVLTFILLLAPLAKWIPLASLAAILFIVAFNMSHYKECIYIFSAPKSDVAVLLITFLLTIFADLSTAIQVGVILSAFFFMKRMTEVAEVNIDNSSSGQSEIDKSKFPKGTQIIYINGPFFFTMTHLLKDALDSISKKPTAFALDMRNVSALDISGIKELEFFIKECHKDNIKVFLVGLRTQPLQALNKTGLHKKLNKKYIIDI